MTTSGSDHTESGLIGEYRAQARAVAGEEQASLEKTGDDFLLACAEGGEAGDADLFIHLYRDRLCFDHAGVNWYFREKHFWLPCELNEPLCLVGGLADHYLKEGTKYFFLRRNAERVGDEKAAKAADRAEKILMAKVRLLRRRQHRANVLVLSAAGENSLGISGREWDTKPLLLPCLNGILDLATGEFREGRACDFILKHCQASWEGYDKPAPRWEAFVSEVMDGDSERIGFLKRLLGSAISGEVVDHVFPIFWGGGRNGKGVLLETLGDVLGLQPEGLAGPVPAEMLMQQKHPRSAAAPSPDVMAFRGLRLAWASESDEGRRFNAGKVKWLSGGDTLTGRGPYDKRMVTFKPSHTLILLTNFRPTGNAQDEALWARVHSIRFPLSFVDAPSKPHERLRNPNLRKELKEEGSGILAWLVSGFFEWVEKGLAPPSSIRSETDEYRRSDDSIQHFLKECCNLDQGNAARAQELFEGYSSFCEESGFKPKGKKTFFQRMEKEFIKDKDKNGIYYNGLCLNRPQILG